MIVSNVDTPRKPVEDLDDLNDLDVDLYDLIIFLMTVEIELKMMPMIY